jgi:hypothetical protein
MIHLCYMISYKTSLSEHQQQHLSQQQTEEAQQQTQQQYGHQQNEEAQQQTPQQQQSHQQNEGLSSRLSRSRFSTLMKMKHRLDHSQNLPLINERQVHRHRG